MARGWESKSVADQMEEADARSLEDEKAERATSFRFAGNPRTA